MAYTPTVDMSGMEVVANTVKLGVTKPVGTPASSAVGIYVGAGAPTFSASKGSLYLNTTGSSTSTRLYVNNGTTNWIAITTAT